MAKKEMTPPDPKQCQSLIPNGNTFMTLGGVPGWDRCLNEPVVIVSEVVSSVEGEPPGSMSLCRHCANKLLELQPDTEFTFEFIGEDKQAENPVQEMVKA
jgi:hypothetical protein